MNADEIVRALRNCKAYKTKSDLQTTMLMAADCIETLQSKNIMLRKLQPVELSGDAARSFALAAELSEAKAQLAESQRREKAAVEDKGVLIKHLRLSGWCNGCKNFAGLDGCRAGQMEKCTGKNDLYEWRGPQEAGEGVTKNG